MKKFLALLLSLMMVLSLAACGSAPAGTDGEGAGDAGTNETDTAIENDDGAEDSIPQIPTISFSDLENNALLVADNAQYSITVTSAASGSWWWRWSEEADYYKDESAEGYHIELSTTNKSDETLYFLPYCAGLNGAEVYCEMVDLEDPERYCLELEQGETADWTICVANTYNQYWTGEETREFSISNDLVESIQLSVGVHTEEQFFSDGNSLSYEAVELFGLYPIGQNGTASFARESHSSDMVLFENEDVTVTAVTDIARSYLSDVGLELFVQDKGKSAYTEYMFEGNIVNGLDTTGMWFDSDGCGIFANGCSYITLSPYKDFNEDYATIMDLNEVDLWEFTLSYTREGVTKAAKISLTAEDIQKLYGEYLQTESEFSGEDIYFGAPDFTIPLVNGGEFTLSEQRGKVVLINFWATWCGPCCREMPAFTWLDEDYSDDEVAILCVNVWDDYGAMKDFIAKNGYSFPIAYDADETVSNLYPTDGIPYTLIIDKEGYIFAEFVGAADAESQYIEYKSVIEEALAS